MTSISNFKTKTCDVPQFRNSFINPIQHNLKPRDILINAYEKAVTWSYEYELKASFLQVKAGEGFLCYIQVKVGENVCSYSCGVTKKITEYHRITEYFRE